MIHHKHLGRAGLVAAFGASAAVLFSGCGGATTSPGRNATAATPTIYGVNPTDGTTGSGIQFSAASTDASGAPTTITVGGLTGALSTTAVPLEGSGSLPLGFAADGTLSDEATAGQAVPASQPGVVFRALIANGNVGNSAGAIVPSSVILTSSEVSGFSQPLTFDNADIGNGPIGNGNYTTAPFVLPFTTSGIHQFTAAVADVGGQNSTTTFGVVVVAPTDVALFVNFFDTGTQDTTTDPKNPTEIINAITPGDTVTIDGGSGTGVYPTGYAVTTADDNGGVVLFTTPGTHTVTEKDAKGAVVQSNTFTLPASAAGTTIYTVPAPNATTTADVRKPHLLKSRMLKSRAIKRH